MARACYAVQRSWPAKLRDGRTIAYREVLCMSAEPGQLYWRVVIAREPGHVFNDMADAAAAALVHGGIVVAVT